LLPETFDYVAVRKKMSPTVDVDYKEKTEAQYDEVWILPDEDKVPVKEVS
jgi:hypothetical protein